MDTHGHTRTRAYAHAHTLAHTHTRTHTHTHAQVQAHAQKYKHSKRKRKAKQESYREGEAHSVPNKDWMIKLWFPGWRLHFHTKKHSLTVTEHERRILLPSPATDLAGIFIQFSWKKKICWKTLRNTFSSSKTSMYWEKLFNLTVLHKTSLSVIWN